MALLLALVLPLTGEFRSRGDVRGESLRGEFLFVRALFDGEAMAMGPLSEFLRLCFEFANGTV